METHEFSLISLIVVFLNSLHRAMHFPQQDFVLFLRCLVDIRIVQVGEDERGELVEGGVCCRVGCLVFLFDPVESFLWGSGGGDGVVHVEVEDGFFCFWGVGHEEAEETARHEEILIDFVEEVSGSICIPLLASVCVYEKKVGGWVRKMQTNLRLPSTAIPILTTASATIPITNPTVGLTKYPPTLLAKLIT